jgi:phosphinothricin acetyltransferase
MSAASIPAFTLRPFDPADAAPLLEIYAPIVHRTAISFESEPPDAAGFARRLTEIQRSHCCWTGSDAQGPAGYAYAARFRERDAYRWSVETSVYVHARTRRRGLARALMQRVLEDCLQQGRRLVLAGIVLPRGTERSHLGDAQPDPYLPGNNRASVELHERLGFRFVGRFEGVGWKFGRGYDVGFWQLPLGDWTSAPEPPRPSAAR